MDVGVDVAQEFSQQVMLSLRQSAASWTFLEAALCPTDDRLVFGEDVSQVLAAQMRAYISALVSEPWIEWADESLSLEEMLARMAHIVSDSTSVQCIGRNSLAGAANTIDSQF